MSERVLSPRTVARSVLIAIGLYAMAYLLWKGRDIMFVLFFGVLVGVFYSVFTDWLEDRGLPRLAALILVLVAGAGLTAGFWILLWPTLTEQLGTVGRDLPRVVQDAMDWVQAQVRSIAGQVGEPPAEVEEQVRSRFAQQLEAMFGGAMPVISNALGAITGLLLVLVIGIYTAARPRLYRTGFLRLIPASHRDRVDEALSRSAHSLRHWMIGTVISMAVVGVMVFAGLTILGVPAALALAVIAAMFEFIPIVGPILASVPAIAVALTVSPMTALWVTLLYVVIQQIEGDVITPVVMRGAVRLPPALTVIFQSFMAVIFGFLGLLLAVPLLAVIIEVVKTLYVEPMDEADGGSGDRASTTATA